MSTATPERRRIAIITGDRRIDLAVPYDDTLGEVLQGLGFPTEAGRYAVLERSGSEAKLSSIGAELPDGALYAIVDLQLRSPASTNLAQSQVSRQERGALWWMLGAVAVVAVALALVEAGTATVQQRLAGSVVLGSVVLGLAALVSAVVWAVRRPRDNAADSLAMLAPLALAFAAGFVAIPLHRAAGVQLGVVAGLLAAAVLAALLTAIVSGVQLRSAAGTATVLILLVAALWGMTLMFGWNISAAAAISAGIAPLGLRALPSTLVNVPEGYHIDYRHFMSARWTVRGTIPESPGAVTMDAVRGVVQDSSARLVTGTAILSAIPVLMVPIALMGPWQSNPVTLGGRLGLLATLIVALLLLPRHNVTSTLRWVPRAAAALIALEAIIAASSVVGALPLLVGSAGFLAIGILAAVVLVPIGRGARSLVWSRFADVFETLAVALSLPAALLAGDVLTLLRGMMAA